MAITSWPYVSIGGDRKITAAQEAQGFDNFVGSGVVPGVDNECEVTKVPDTLNVSVNTGAAIISGHRMISDEAETLILDAGDSQPRIDLIALESNANTAVRGARFVIVKGTPAASPEVPALTQTDAIYQIALAKITVPASATNLNMATLVDMRTYASGKHGHSELNSLRVKDAVIEGTPGVINAIVLPSGSSDPTVTAEMKDGIALFKYAQQ